MITRGLNARRDFYRRLAADESGATILEFGLIMSVFITLLLGLFDLGQLVYATSILKGATETAARSSSLETSNTEEADAKVRSIVSGVAIGAEITSTRRSYFDFEDIGRPESWNDRDGNGDCNDGEAYVDENGNEMWDADIGKAGNGGAGDVVLYTVTMTYDPLFPNPFLPGGTKKREATATTIKKNQPFADQDTYGSIKRICDA